MNSFLPKPQKSSRLRASALKNNHAALRKNKAEDLVCQSEGPQGEDDAGTIFDIVLDHITLLGIGYLLLAFLTSSDLKGLAIYLKVTDARENDILCDAHLVEEERLANVADICCRSAQQIGEAGVVEIDLCSFIYWSTIVDLPTPRGPTSPNILADQFT